MDISEENRASAIRAAERLAQLLKANAPLPLVEDNVRLLLDKCGIDPAKLKPMEFTKDGFSVLGEGVANRSL